MLSKNENTVIYIKKQPIKDQSSKKYKSIKEEVIEEYNLNDYPSHYKKKF